MATKNIVRLGAAAASAFAVVSALAAPAAASPHPPSHPGSPHATALTVPGVTLAPREFPRGYTATLLNPSKAAEAVRDINLTGRIQPQRCAAIIGPSSRKQMSVLVGQGVGAINGSITVVVTPYNIIPPRRAQLLNCQHFRAVSAVGVPMDVTVFPYAPPRGPFADGFEYRQSGVSGQGNNRHFEETSTILGTTRGYTVQATYLTSIPGVLPPDKAGALRAAFDAAINKVNAAR